jgi:hypothetical protein
MNCDCGQAHNHKLKFYVLTSNGLPALRRHIDPEYSNIPKSQLVVVINSLSETYIQAATEYCEEEGLEYYITESNGTPARGKNSVLDLFLESDNDYMVMIDGDDFLTPHGVYMYQAVAEQHNPPQAICLKNQISTIADYELMAEKGINHTTLKLEDVPYRVIQFFTANWDSVRKADVVGNLRKMGCTKELAKKQGAWHHEFYRLQEKYCEDSEAHCRVTWVGKEAAKTRFPEHLTVGEDTIFYFKLKHRHVTEGLDIRCNDEMQPTYIYDQRTPGTVFNEVNRGKDWAWMEKYNDEVHKMEKEGKIQQFDLPLLTVDYSYPYSPNVLKFGTNGQFEYFNGEERGFIDLPNNSSEKSLHNAYERLTEFYK